jgi:hypothetical protein
MIYKIMLGKKDACLETTNVFGAWMLLFEIFSMTCMVQFVVILMSVLIFLKTWFSYMSMPATKAFT